MLTSVPPFTPKRETDLGSVSEQYRNSCIQSWQSVGDRAISVNSVAEQNHSRNQLGIQFTFVESDGRRDTGRPLILFNDLVDVAIDSDCEFLLLTNSDIFLARQPELLDEIAGTGEGQCLVSQRANITSLANSEAEAYDWGYDLFVVHRNDFKKLRTDIPMYFGEPWWDYHVLCILQLRGVEIVPLECSHVLHLVHPEAYSWSRWTEIGSASLNDLSRSAIRSESCSTLDQTQSSELSKRIRESHRLLKSLRRVDRMLWNFARELYSRPQAPYSDPRYFVLQQYSHSLRQHANDALRFQAVNNEFVERACQELRCKLEM